MISNQPFAEILESSLHIWKAQSWDWQMVPPFGSLLTVKTEHYILFGIVYDLQTSSFDAVRMPFAYQKTEEELQREQPQIFAFLKTIFSCVIVGYHEDNKTYYQLPPTPAKIHSFVMHAHDELYCSFFESHEYAPLLFSMQQLNLDELLLAIMHQIAQRKKITVSYLDEFTDIFCLLAGSDYRRLKMFLQRLQRYETITKKSGSL